MSRKAKSRTPLARSHAVALSAPLALTVVAFLSALGMGFAGDDITFLSRAAGIEHAKWGTQRLLSGPLAWSVQYQAFGMNATPYAGVRLALHLVATSLVYAVGVRLQLSRLAAAFAALYFGVSMVAVTP